MTLSTFGTLFSGGEGAGIGLQAAGLRHMWGVEYDPAIAAVAQRNGFAVRVADVRAVDYTTLPAVDWLHASPVCTRASNANPNATESPEDIDTAAAVVRALDAIRPQVFTLENVWGYRDFTAFKTICKALGDHGYFWDFEHVNAADMGVPQTRKRLILRASRGMLPHLPAPVPWVGWYEAIEDLIPTLPESQLAPWQLARLPEGIANVLISNAKTEYGNGMASAEEPAWSVTSQTAGRSRAVLVTNAKDKPGSVDVGAVMCKSEQPSVTITAQADGRFKALLFAGDSSADSWGDNYREAEQPAFTAKENGVGRQRVLVTEQANEGFLVCGILNDNGEKLTIRSQSNPAFTVTTQINQRDIKAALPGGYKVVSITPRALARFQSVPDEYWLPEKRGLAAKVIGNMVPPLLMQRIAENMMEANQ